MDGFWALTDSGRFQIDGTTVNMGVRYHTTLTANAGYQLAIAGSNFGVVYSISCPGCDYVFTADYPNIAIFTGGTTPVTLITCINQGGNVWKATFWAQSPTNFEVYVFDKLDSITSGNNFGMKIYGPTGQLIADALVPFARPISLINLQATNIGPNWTTGTNWPRGFTNDYSQAGRTKVAVGAIQTGHAEASVSSNNSNGSSASGYMSISGWTSQIGGGVQMRWTDNTYGSPGGSYPGTYVGYGSDLYISGLLIDVTGVP